MILELRKAWQMSMSRQHGAWAALLSCFLVGMIAGGGLNWPPLMLLASGIFAFLAQHTWVVWFRLKKGDPRKFALLFFLVLYALLFLTFSLPLFLCVYLWYLIPLGILASAIVGLSMVLVHLKLEHSLLHSVIGMLGLSLFAPAAEYAGSRELGMQTVAVWLLCALFFVGSVLHVRYLMSMRKHYTGTRSVQFRCAALSLAYHVSVLGLLLAIGPGFGFSVFWILLAWTPVTLKVLAAAARKIQHPIPPRRIGIHELVHALLFIVFAAMLFTQPGLNPSA